MQKRPFVILISLAVTALWAVTGCLRTPARLRAEYDTQRTIDLRMALTVSSMQTDAAPTKTVVPTLVPTSIPTSVSTETPASTSGRR